MARLPSADLPRTRRSPTERLDRLERSLAYLRSVAGGRLDPAQPFSLTGALRALGGLATRGEVSWWRSDGSQALWFRRFYPNSTGETFELLDRASRPIVAENSLGAGLARPSLEMPFQPVGPAETPITCGPYGYERTTASSDWDLLFAYTGKVQNAFLDLQVAVRASDTETAGEVRVARLDTGAQLGGYFVAGWTGVIEGTATTVLDPAVGQIVTPISLGAGSRVRLGLQVRRTAGTGSLTVSVPQSIGG